MMVAAAAAGAAAAVAVVGAVVRGAAFVVMAVGLLFSVVHYHRRLQDSHRKLYRFIRENLHLHEELDGFMKNNPE